MAATALLLLLAPCAPGLAFSDFGHELVARLAWQRLSPAARSAAIALLQQAPVDSQLPGLYPTFDLEPTELDRIFFERAATWADLARQLPAYDHANWHYVNYYWERSELTGDPIDRVDLVTATPNIVTQLELLSARLADPARLPADRAIDLAWILHLVGDIHQPLHCASRVAPGGSEETGDRGGNQFPLVGVNEDDLHGLWDFAVESWRPRRDGEPFPVWVDRIVDEIRERHGMSRVTDRTLKPGDFRGWAEESYLTTKTIAYPPELVPGRPPPDAYRELAFDITIDRIALAGYRLAVLLEAALDPAAEPGVGPSE